MIQLDRLIADFEDCIGWPYAAPGTNDHRGIDCSGMFVRAFRLQGQRDQTGYPQPRQTFCHLLRI